MLLNAEPSASKHTVSLSRRQLFQGSSLASVYTTVESFPSLLVICTTTVYSWGDKRSHDEAFGIVSQTAEHVITFIVLARRRFVLNGGQGMTSDCHSFCSQSAALICAISHGFDDALM